MQALIVAPHTVSLRTYPKFLAEVASPWSANQLAGIFP